MPLGNNSMYAGKDAPWVRGISNLGIALFGDPVFKAQQEQQAKAEEWRQQQEATRQSERAQDVAFQKEKFDWEKSQAAGDSAFDKWLFTDDQPVVAPGDPTLPVAPVVDPATPAVDPAAAATVAAIAPAAGGDDYYAKSRVAESSNDYKRQLSPEAQAAGQTASGGYAFINGTWKSLGGTTESAHLATPEEQDRVMKTFTLKNAAEFKAKTGRDPTDSELRAMHHFGGPRGLAFIAAPDATPMEQVLPAEWFTHNPHLKGKTVGQVKAEFRQKFGDGMTWQGPSLPGTDAQLPEAAEGPLPSIEQSPLAELFTGPLPPQIPYRRTAPNDVTPEVATPELLAPLDTAARPEYQDPGAVPTTESATAHYGGTGAPGVLPTDAAMAGGSQLDPMLFMDPGGRLPMLDGEPETPLPDIAPAAGEPAPVAATPAPTPAAAPPADEGVTLPPDVEEAVAAAAPEELLPGMPLNNKMRYLMENYGLTKRQVAAIAMAPEGERQKVLSSILASKPAAEEGAGGPFAGSGMDASLLNIVYDYQTRRARGEQMTAEDDYKFRLAKSQLETPKYYVGADGQQRKVTYHIPEMGSGEVPTIQEEIVGANAAPPADATAPGATPAPTAAAPAETSAEAPAGDENQPVDLVRDNVSIEQLPSGEKALTETQSKYLSYFNRADHSQGQIAEAIAEGVDPGSSKIYAFYQASTSKNMVAQWAAYKAMTPAEQKYIAGVQMFLSGVLRADTGAAVTPDEWAIYYPQYFAMPGETDENKAENRQVWLDSDYAGLGPNGKRAADEARALREQRKTEKANQPQGGGTMENPARPRDQAEFDALPPGTYFINPADDKLKRKK